MKSLLRAPIRVLLGLTGLTALVLGLSAGEARAQTLNLEVLPPSPVQINVQQDLRINYAFTGADAENVVITITPAPGFVIQDISAPAPFTPTCNLIGADPVPAWARTRHWQCTATAPLVETSAGGGVSGQISVRVIATSHYFADGDSALFTASATIAGNAAATASASTVVNPTPINIARLNTGGSTVGTIETPEGDVERFMESYFAVQNNGQAIIAPEGELRSTIAGLSGFRRIFTNSTGQAQSFGASNFPATSMTITPWDTETQSVVTYNVPLGFTNVSWTSNPPKGNRALITNSAWHWQRLEYVNACQTGTSAECSGGIPSTCC